MVKSNLTIEEKRQIREEGIEKGRLEGIKKGKEEEKRNTAKNLKYLGVSIDKISRATGLSIEEIEKL